MVGLQYYHTACIFLTLSDPSSHILTDYERARSRRVAEVCDVEDPFLTPADEAVVADDCHPYQNRDCTVPVERERPECVFHGLPFALPLLVSPFGKGNPEFHIDCIFSWLLPATPGGTARIAAVSLAGRESSGLADGVDAA